MIARARLDYRYRLRHQPIPARILSSQFMTVDLTTSVAATALDPRTLAQLSSLQLRARKIVEGLVAGMHRSPYRGFSVEFAEHREYAPGDDLRYLDWKVYGRTDKLYLKQYEDETNLICYLALDISRSMTYRGPDSALSKLEYAQCLAIALGWLVLQHQDAAALATFDSRLREYVVPSSNATRLPDLVDVMESAKSQEDSAIAPALHELAGQLHRRGVVIVISDCFDDLEQVLSGLRQLVHHRHDVALLQILDDAELEFPFDRPTRFRGLEQATELRADSRAIRAAYRREVVRFLDRLRHGCLFHAIDYRLVTTSQSIEQVLSTFLAPRRRRT